jgi:putative ABC exporter
VSVATPPRSAAPVSPGPAPPPAPASRAPRQLPAILELVLLGLRGRLLRRGRMLRRPRHLVAFLAGIAYFSFFALRPLLQICRRPAALSGWLLSAPDLRAAAQIVLALGLALGVTLTWLLASSRPPLTLSEAEAHLLLPAPIPRRSVLRYALLRQQPALLFGALVLSFFAGFDSPAARLARFLASWALLTLVDLHLAGVSLLKARWREEPPRSAALGRGVAVALGAAWWAAVVFALQKAWLAATAGGAGAAAAGTAGRELLAHLLAAIHAGPLDELLAPFLWLAAPMLGAGAGERLVGVAAVAALLALHYEWVLRSRVRFEEAAVERARRSLARRRARRQSFAELAPRVRRLAPFALASTGAPEAAIYWKNLMLRRRTPLARQALLLAIGLALFAAGLAAARAMVGEGVLLIAGLAGGTGLGLLCGVPPLAGIFCRNDLRADLPEVEVLRPWPVPGARLVAAEVLAAATRAVSVALSGAGLAAASALAMALAGGEKGGGLPWLPGWALAGAPRGVGLALVLGSLALAGAPLALVSVAVQNVAVLLLPGWIALGVDRRRGMADAGQAALTGIVHLLALAAAALPAALAVALVAGIANGLAGLPFTAWELPFLALAAGLPLLVEAALLVRFGGVLWDRLDPSQEILEAPAAR